jgi:prefoldin subunit 5
MCGFTCDLIDFDELTVAQKKTLLKNLQRKKRSLQTQIEDINESLKGIDRCMKVVEKKSKRRG